MDLKVFLLFDPHFTHQKLNLEDANYLTYLGIYHCITGLPSNEKSFRVIMYKVITRLQIFRRKTFVHPFQRSKTLYLLRKRRLKRRWPLPITNPAVYLPCTTCLLRRWSLCTWTCSFLYYRSSSFCRRQAIQIDWLPSNFHQRVSLNIQILW